MIMDFQFVIDSKSKKSASKKGRKSGLPFSFSLSPREEATDAPETTTSTLPKTRRTGGWASETLKSAIRRSSSAFFEQDQLEERSKVNDDDDIPVIPNLDDYDDDDVAKAPLVGHQVSSYKELEIDLLKHAAFSSLEDVNLRVLTAFLQTESALEEPDTVWSRNLLFSEVLTHMRQGEINEDNGQL